MVPRLFRPLVATFFGGYMKSSRVMKIFEQYVRSFDMNNTNIKAKYFHSLKTMELSREIASNLGIFNEEEIVVCELIGLFHEIGSFNKNPDFHIINDNSFDYTNKSLEILFNDGLIRKITKDERYDGIIKFAIYSLNKNGYPDNLDSKVIGFCNVLKDSHNLDLFRLVINYPYIDTRIDSYPTSMVYDDFKLFKRIESKITENNADEVLMILSNVFALCYRYSYYVIKRENYIGKLINALSYSDDNVNRFFNSLEKVLNVYVERKIGDMYVGQEI